MRFITSIERAPLLMRILRVGKWRLRVYRVKPVDGFYRRTLEDKFYFHDRSSAEAFRSIFLRSVGYELGKEKADS